MEVITSKKLNAMADNSEFFAVRKVDGKVRNIDPHSKKPRDSLPYIGDNIAVYADYREITPGDAFPEKQKGKTKLDHFEKRIDFPVGFFNPNFQPVVICSIGAKHGAISKVTSVIRSITFAGFNISILEHSTSHFTESMPYFISFIAMGVKGGPLDALI